ncbi:uncharacterized protein HD556DRAFT_936759 [Suillus plorans]|uniref:Tat pathway signal sequence n=1 Tax=Suillus plorans TaxID=116603 RepID=A0A9P7AG46_9AGAM|nr:uncharacterized protein HD556DRAFT_936759 [Suillus plorans]KAG1787747.1 hypothetical protein HD556DRAFT_936759 [Suillus plorans]
MESLYSKAMIKYFLQYSPIDFVDDETLSGGAERFGTKSRPKSRTRRLWLSHGILICTSILSFALWMRTPSTQLRNDIPSIYSSAAVEPVILRLNGTFDFPSIYRGPPSPEIDAVWNRISRDVGPTRMTREEMLKAGTTSTELRSKVRYPEEVGGGYMTSIEAVHQLHCVNLLRKASWFEHYSASTDRSFQFPPDAIHRHIGHCIEMIRQNIMCRADTTMLTWHWVQGYDSPHAKFSTRHRCRNFEKIMDWSTEHAIHIDESEMKRFEDTIDLPKPPRDA